MDDCYAYAEAQFLGMQFQEFTFRRRATQYRWQGWRVRLGPALALLARLGLRVVAKAAFAKLVEVI